MPIRAPHLCGCGRIVPAGERCACQKAGDAARKARHDRTRPSSRERGYNAEWRKYRLTFLAAHPWCAMCGAVATTVDHIIQHKGNDRLFWDTTNHQPLCTRCHSRHKQRAEHQVTP